MLTGADFRSTGDGSTEAVESSVTLRALPRVIIAASVGLLLALCAVGCIGPGLEPPGDDRGGSGVTGPAFGNPTGSAGSPSDFGNNTGAPGTVSPPAMPPNTQPPPPAVVDMEDDAGVDEAAVCGGPRVPLVPPPLAGMQDICVVQLPPESGGMLDPSQIVIELSDPGEIPLTLTNVHNADGCFQIPGGYFFDEPALPTSLTLCPAACSSVAAGGNLALVLGCQP